MAVGIISIQTYRKDSQEVFEKADTEISYIDEEDEE